MLTACVTPSAPRRPEPVAPPAPDPRTCAQVPAEPRLPAGAAIVKPALGPEAAATEAFLNWVAAELDWGRVLAARAELARQGCK